MIEFRKLIPSEIGEEYWRRTADDRLPLMKCRHCGQLRRYLTRVCYRCQHTDYDWIEAGGGGTIYAFTEIFYPPTDEFEAPFVLALVDLDEGVRMMANILHAKGDDLAIGQRVKVVFEDMADGKRVPQFEVDAASPALAQRPAYAY